MGIVYSKGYALDILAFPQLNISSAYNSFKIIYGTFFPVLIHTCFFWNLLYS